MPYSLVSAATLGFDLVRLPAGRSVATVLLAALGADARSLAAVAAVHPGRGLEPGERGALAVRSRKARELAASVPHLRTAADGATDRAAVLVAQLERGTIGDAPTLERLLREDVLGREHLARGFLSEDEWDEAADVLADAALGHWATAMHEASWAGHVSGRTRTLAIGQLHAVQAFLEGGFDLHDGAAGVWNALAGCVQGTAVADLLDDNALAVLQAPWKRVSGL